jgi:hypothetical protein
MHSTFTTYEGVTGLESALNTAEPLLVVTERSGFADATRLSNATSLNQNPKLMMEAQIPSYGPMYRRYQYR